jgi:glycerol-3-phosphate dehydrogenase (NAD(P)+)
MLKYKIDMKNLTIVGAGAWGTALAYIFRDTDYQVLLWSKNETIVNEINTSRKNTKYSGDKTLAGIKASTDIINATKQADIIINALPAHTIKDIFIQTGSQYKKNAIIINASKAIDPGTHQLPHQIFKQLLPSDTHYYSLSGPGFASGLFENHPTTINIAGENQEHIIELKNSLQKNHVYLAFSNDIIGVEWGGIYKNVVAIAAGFAEGLGYGENTNALIFSAGFKEMVQSGVSLGAKLETFYEPCGVGDLMLSTSSMKSRNYSFGFHLAKEQNPKNIFRKLSGVAEGYYTLQSTEYLKTKHNLTLPLSNMLNEIIFHNSDHKNAFLKFLESRFK